MSLNSFSGERTRLNTIMTDREILVSFIADIGTGVIKEEVPGRICYIPLRDETKTNDDLWSGEIPSGLKLIFNYGPFPEKPDKNENLGLYGVGGQELTEMYRIPQNMLEKIMSNVYLYKGFVEPNISEHLEFYLKGEYDMLKALWKEFCPSADSWEAPFTFELSENIEDIYAVYDSELIDDYRKATYKKRSFPTYFLYKSEGRLLTNHIEQITKFNSAYYLLMREVHRD